MAKTTFVIDDELMKQLREAASQTGSTLSELVEGALRRMLERNDGERRVLAALPTFNGGEPHVDIADRAALYQAMAGR